jgi:outer membrane protein
MKALNIIIQVVLVVAVIYLFLERKSGDFASKENSIAIVNADSLSLKYKYAVQQKNMLMSLEDSLNKKLESAVLNLQNRFAVIQEQARAWPQHKIEEAKVELQQHEQGVEQLRQSLASTLQSRTMAAQDKYLEKVNGFLNEYGEKNGFQAIMSFQLGSDVLWYNQAHDVTNELIEKLNEEFASLPDSTKNK